MTMTEDHTLANAILAHAAQVGRLADSIDHLAVASQALRLPAGPAGAPMATVGPPATAGGPPGAPSMQDKMSKKVFAICKSNGWDIGTIGTQVLQRPISADSRTWTIDELKAVLDQFKEWGVG